MSTTDARRDVVDEDRHVDRVVDRLVVPVEAFLGRLVVIGRDHQHGVGAGLLGVAGQLDRLGGGVGAGAGDHRHAAGAASMQSSTTALVLVMGERRRFAGGADRHQAVRAGADLALDELAEGLLIDRAVVERRDQRGETIP